MIEDPIVEEIRQHRKAHAAEHGNDLGRIVQALRKRERESDRPVLNPGPKTQFNVKTASLYNASMETRRDDESIDH